MAASSEGTLDQLLEFVKETRGFDFTGYKRSSIERRVAKRMGEVGVERYEDYLDYLELHGEEFARAVQHAPDQRHRLLPRPADLGVPGRPSIVPAAASSIGGRRAAPGLVRRLRVRRGGLHGRDGAGPRAAATTRSASGSRSTPPTSTRRRSTTPARAPTCRARSRTCRADALERFFERTDQRYVFRKDLRRCVIFGRNDLVQDAPISRIDLLVCRNTLMYFTAETQAQILRRFHFALDDDGVLLLGKSEMLITHTDLFTPIELKRRVFRKVVKPTLRDRVRVLAADPTNGACAERSPTTCARRRSTSAARRRSCSTPTARW